MNESMLAAGDHLRVRFVQRADRWAHQIEASDASGVLWRLESVEAAADETWPPSPPLQSLQWHSTGEQGPVALLVGMAGASHWSATVATDGGHILLDVACRLSTAPLWLGSTYRLSGPDGNPLPPNVNQPKIDLLPPPTADDPRAVLESVGGRITIRIDSLAARLPRTVRWQYAVSVV